MAGLLQKFGVMLWKSFTIRKHHWFMTLIEIFLPILLFLILVLANNAVEHNYRVENDTVYPVKTEADIFKQFEYDTQLRVKIFYCPSNQFTDGLMAKLLQKLNLGELNLEALASESDMEAAYLAQHNNSTYSALFGIVFSGKFDNVTHQKLTYKIRSTMPDSSYIQHGDLYVDKGFMAFQITLDKSFIEMVGSKGVLNKVALQKFPDVSYVTDAVKETILGVLVICVTTSFIFLCASILKRVVEERASGVKELMKLMGLKTWMLWFGWLMNALIMCAVSVSFITILMKVQFHSNIPSLITCEAGILWIFLMLYCTASIFMLFAVSALISRPNHALAIGLVLWIGSYIYSEYLWKEQNKYGLSVKMLSCLLPNVGMMFGVNIINGFESSGGLAWSAFCTTPKALMLDISMGHVWLMFLVDVIVFGIITLYLEAVMPGKYGIARPWYFLFLPSFWRFNNKLEIMKVVSSEKNNYEEVPDNLVPGIRIQGLRKEYHTSLRKPNKVAVDGVTLDIYKDHITALLGHNGAGKSTTMMILTGMFSPTSGNVYINGFSIQNEMEKVRDSLGLCPQENMLFVDLTVMEHFIFFGMLKGSSKRDAERDGDELITALGLRGHENKFPRALSGGMKRKLCLGIALTGKSKVVILDEPTSGLDPEGRRKVWDLLLNMRGQRTILITTHLMEEADVLGDYIAIMDHGRIQCYGTSMYLKKLYGTGYQLSLLKKMSFDGLKITEAVKSYVPDASLKNDMQTVMTYNLPVHTSPQLANLFSMLEENKSELGINGMGISITTLEEVFLRVGFISTQDDDKNSSEASEEPRDLNNSLEDITGGKVVGLALLRQQVKALFYKNLLFTQRYWISFCIQVVVQIGFIILLTTISLHQSSPTKDNKPVTFNLDMYGKTKVLYSAEEGVPNSLVDFYKSNVKSAGSDAEAIPQTSNVISELLKINLHHTTNYAVAAEFNSSSNVTNALYSYLDVQSPPISLNLINNALLKYATGSDNYSITTISHPFPQEKVSQYIGVELVTASWMLILPVAFTFWVGMFMILPLSERVSANKQLQLMCGISPFLYWLTSFLWDFLIHLCLVTLMIVAVASVDPYFVFSGSEELGVLSLLLILYGLATIPFCFMISYWKNTIGGAFSILFAILIGGLILPLIVAILELVKYDGLAKFLDAIFRVIPNIAFTSAISGFSRLVVMNNICKLLNDNTKQVPCLPNTDCSEDYCRSIRQPYLVKEHGILNQVFYLAFSSLLYFFIIFLVDFGFFQCVWKFILMKFYSTEIGPEILDSEVQAEKKRVKTVFQIGHLSSSSSDLLLVNDLKKKYNRNTVAVKELNFGVMRGECFGLLGVNGAGKTTTFKMLTGDIIPSSGDASIETYKLTSARRMYLSQIGYCPQFDAIIECFTGWEILQLFARLRGVRENDIGNEIERWINLLGLTEYQNARSGTYSGGNKRKLSAAIALVGSPSLIFLDEPTSGVDPISRRSMWNAVTKIQKSGQSIVLTSHSMEECEALCSRLAIMVNGQFMCLGSIQQLKQKFGQGFSIRIQLSIKSFSPDKVKSLKVAMESKFQCVLKDEHQVLLHYQVTDPKTTWSYMFTCMEQLKQQHSSMEDYTISETTLEQVFLSFAKSEA